MAATSGREARGVVVHAWIARGSRLLSRTTGLVVMLSVISMGSVLASMEVAPSSMLRSQNQNEALQGCCALLVAAGCGPRLKLRGDAGAETLSSRLADARDAGAGAGATCMPARHGGIRSLRINRAGGAVVLPPPDEMQDPLADSRESCVAAPRIFRLRGGGAWGQASGEHGADRDQMTGELLGDDAEGARLLREEDGGQLLEKSRLLVAKMLRLKQQEKERLSRAKNAETGMERGTEGQAIGAGAGEGGEEDGAGGDARETVYEAEKRRVEYEMDLCVSHFKSRLLDLLDWRKESPRRGVADGNRGAGGGGDEECDEPFDEWEPGMPGMGKAQGKAQDAGASVESKRDNGMSVEEGGGGGGKHTRSEPPAHSRGGFACVLLDQTYNVAYRLEPMRNQVDAAAWLAFTL